MIDNTVSEMDSLRQTGEALFVTRELNLTDLLFSYGVRINYNLVEDLYSSKIAIATGNIGDKTQFKQFLWRYYPLIPPNESHPITKRLEPVNLRFPTNIDTLKNAIHKEILLQSSPLTKLTGLPNIIKLSSIADNIRPELYATQPQILGVLLEGRFTSAYRHRSQAFKTDFKEIGLKNKMIVISDGDIARNQITDGQPTRMDMDKWTGQHFGNKSFMLNAVDYLLDDTGLISLRGKSLDIKILNKEKVRNQRTFWQFINIALPLILLGIFGLGFSYYRKKKYL
jgi:gliding-associated putative ABC transporter substrate-binding component GldG